MELLEPGWHWIYFNGRYLPKYAYFLDTAASGRTALPVSEECSRWFWHFTICMGVRKSAPSQEVLQHAGELLELMQANPQQLEAEVENHFEGENASEMIRSWVEALQIMMEEATRREHCVWTGEIRRDPPPQAGTTFAIPEQNAGKKGAALLSSAEPMPAPSPAGIVRCKREEYLAHERAIQTKNEYYDGKLRPMKTATLDHVRITGNIVSALSKQLREQSLKALTSQMRILAEENYFYPDVLIVQDAPQLEDAHRDTLLNPAVIIEVLSPFTEAFDRGRKFASYRTIPTLREYVLVSQHCAQVEHYRRLPGDTGQWILTIAEGEATSVVLLEDVIGSGTCRLELKDVYDGVFDSFDLEEL